MPVDIEISHCTVSDSAAMVAYMDAIAAETDFVTFSGEGSPYTVEQEERFIEELYKKGNGVLMCAKVRLEIRIMGAVQ